MMNSFRTPAAADRRSTPHWLQSLAGIVLLAFGLHAIAQAPAAPGGAAPPPAAEDLSQLVGPIALYPDDLVAIILPASTIRCNWCRRTAFSTSGRPIPSFPSTTSGTTR